MADYLLTPRALADLDAIADHTLDHWGPRQTEQYLENLVARFQWLANNPQLGRARDEIATGYRSFPEGRHVVFYVLRGDDIAIIGVPHSAMDVTSDRSGPR